MLLFCTYKKMLIGSMLSLNASQIKRLRSAFVDSGFAKSLAHARKLTASPSQCRKSAVRFFQLVGVPSDMEDIADFYTVPDSLCDKAMLDSSESELAQTDVSESPTTVKRRGLGRKSAMTLYRLRVSPVLLDRVKSLGGNTSEHIRQAISAYCDSYS